MIKYIAHCPQILKLEQFVITGMGEVTQGRKKKD